MDRFCRATKSKNTEKTKKINFTKAIHLINQAYFDTYKLPRATTEEIVETEQKMAKNIPDELKAQTFNLLCVFS